MSVEADFKRLKTNGGKFTSVTFALIEPDTIGDLRALMRIIDALGLPDDHLVDDGSLAIDLTTACDVAPIQCANHFPRESLRYDLLVETHTCEVEA